MALSGGMPAAEVDFSDSEQARAWFLGQPIEVCIALAIRSALRVLPLINAVRETTGFAPGLALAPVINAPRPTQGFGPGLALPLLRACFVVWAIAQYPFPRDRTLSVAASAYAATNARATYPYAFVYAVAATAIATARAYDAAYAATGPAGADAAGGAYVAVNSAGAAYVEYTAVAHYTFQADAVAIEQGRTVAEIIAAPLWPGEIPDQIAHAWHRLRSWMLEDKANYWEPWVRWYERVRDGRPSFGEAFDLAVASLTDQQWNEEPVPAAVNRRIAALLAEHTAPDPIPPEIDEKTLPQQTPRAPIFQPNQSGVIDLAPPTAADRLADTAEVRDLYDETREKLDELISVGCNMLGDRLARASDKLRSRMPDSMSEAVERLVWSSGNTLRGILRAHDAVADGPDPHFDRLDRGAAERLRDVVNTFNQLAIADPSLRARDAGRPGPQEHERTLKEIETVAEPVAKAATDRNITTQQAGEQLSESAAIAEEAGSSLTDRLAIELARDTGRNFIASIVVSAYRMLRHLPAHARGEGGFIPQEFFKGFHNAAGAAAFAGVAGAAVGAYYIRWEIVQFIISNADVLRLYAAYAFEQSPGFKQMIDWLEAHVPIEK